MKAYESNSYTITVKSGSEHKKIFKLIFDKRDGSILIPFPYLDITEGILAKVRLNANMTYPTKIDLAETGKVTSHIVKYNHHPDGEAHFSQDGKIKTEIRKKSVILNDYNSDKGVRSCLLLLDRRIVL
ncbi:TPA: hypothetical protein JBJ29_14690 [Legionella pneumophila]|nr:hypothetical protein [Legionella pneumophila]